MSLLTHTEEEFAIVRWFHNNKELSVGRKRNQRLKITTAGTMHFLCLERCTPADSGVYTAKTNCDETTCEVAIAGKGLLHIVSLLILPEYPYRFSSGLPIKTVVHEDMRAEFEVETVEEEAAVRWFSNDTELIPEHNR